MIFILVVLFVVSRFGRSRDTRADFYTGGRTVTTLQSGLALFGTFLTITSFLALCGDVALRGYEGILLAAGFAVSWLVALLLVAEPLRNTGTYSLGDILSVRMRPRPVRAAAATVTLLVFFLFMTVQLVGAGSLVSVLFGLTGPLGRATVIVTISGITATIVYYGGMRGTTWTQIVKSVLLLAAVVAVAGALLVRYRFDVSELLDAARLTTSPDGRPRVAGMTFGDGEHRVEFVSQIVTTMLGCAALPYLFAHFLTVPSAKHTRRSVSWAIGLLTPYFLLVVTIGLGGAALLGPDRILAAPGQGLSTVPLLSRELGGIPLHAFVASVILTTIVAVSAALTISAATTFARDVYANMSRHTDRDETREIRVARRGVVVLCVLVTGTAVLLMNQNVTYLLSIDITLVASSILPTLLLSWLWRRFTTAGALWCLYGGTASTILLVVFSPAVSGDPLALFPHMDFAFLPWRHVGLFSMPLAVLLGCVGAGLSRERDDAKFAEMEVRALTGTGAAGPLLHDDPPDAR